jgi:hypothetical protein
MTSLANDLAFGVGQEVNKHPFLECVFGEELVRQTGFASMDYKGKTVYVELKTRRIKHDQYPTALISASKVDFCEKSNADCYFVYQYTDGWFYIKYDKTLFATFWTDKYTRTESPDMVAREKDTIFIPVQYLKPLPASFKA